MPPSPSAPTENPQAGTIAFKRTTLAVALGGFACFFLLYGTQAILPQLAGIFSVTPSVASLTVSAGTLTMALFLVPLSLLSDRFGRVFLMKWALLGAAGFALASTAAPDFTWLLISRVGLGICIAVVPAATLAYLGEELPPSTRGVAIGLYISGNVLGGMSSRFVSALFTDWLGWRYGLLALGSVGLIAALLFWRLLPPSRHFVPQSMQPRILAGVFRQIYTDPGLPWLFTIAFLATGAFIGTYNYIGFRLHAPPYSLSGSAIGAVFLLYLIGSVASTWGGYLSQRVGRQRIMLLTVVCMIFGIGMTLLSPLLLVILGLTLFTFGFFATHSVASSWVSHRAGERRGLVSALYLSSYYLGSSIIGSAVGTPWSIAAWHGVVMALLACLVPVLLITHALRRLPDH